MKGKRMVQTGKKNEINKKNRNKRIAFWTGLICIAVYYLPYLILGENAAYRITDFLDDEVVQYLLGGKYFFASAGTTVQEILAGADLSSIQPPCFLLIWFFRFLPFFHAVRCSMLFLAVMAYAGMFLLCDYCLDKESSIPAAAALPATVIAAVCFAILPFYPTYGLSSLGLPLVAWAFLRLLSKPQPESVPGTVSVSGTVSHKTASVISYLTILFFALTSSLVWSGYFVIGFALLGALVLRLRHRTREAGRVALGALILIITYLWVFRSTIYSLLFSDFVSHRSDPARQYHAPSLHTYIMAFSLLVIVAGFALGAVTKWAGRRNGGKSCLSMKRVHLVLAALWVGALFIAVFAAFYDCHAGYAIRAHLGVLESFQLDRVYWMYPMLWYLILALSCAIVVSVIQIVGQIVVKKRIVAAGLQTLFLVGIFAFSVGHIVENSVEYSANLRAVMTGEENTFTTYREFYEPELFAEIQDYIGRDVSEYRVASLGLVPAIATVNGFYTVDAYSTSYSLEYKYAFREVIAPELAKSEALRSYYDDWGSRCYLFSSELGMNFSVLKEQNIVLQNYEADTAALGELGCDYILSAVEIANAEETGLTFLEHFEREDSAIEIFLYGI